MELAAGEAGSFEWPCAPVVDDQMSLVVDFGRSRSICTYRMSGMPLIIDVVFAAFSCPHRDADGTNRNTPGRMRLAGAA